MADRRMPFDDITRLAAAHAALDPDRQEWRSDIVSGFRNCWTTTVRSSRRGSAITHTT